LLRLATRVLACSLNVPEPLVHSTGVFVFAQVQAVETSVGRTLCPIRLRRRLLAWCRQARQFPAANGRAIEPKSQPRKTVPPA
jgi:hypothetical protein